MGTFSDDFSGNLSKWNYVPSGWVISGGQLVSNSSDGIQANVTVTGDFVYTCTLKANTGTRRIKFTNTDSSHYMSLWLTFNSNGVLGQFINTGEHTWNSAQFNYDNNTDLEISITRTGNKWYYSLNGTNQQPSFTYDDWLNDTISQLLLTSETTDLAYWDNINVTGVSVTYLTTSLKSVIRVQNWLSVNLKSVIDVKPIVTTTLLNKIHIVATLTNTLTVQGNVLGDSPEKPAQIDKLIFITVNNIVFPDMTEFQVETRGNDQNTTFTITYNSPEDLHIFTGQIIKVIELHGDPDGFFTGIIQDIKEDVKSGSRVWTITGRDTGSPLVNQPFALNAVITNPTSFTSEECLNMILFDTRIEIGTCVDISVPSIMNQNDVYNGWAGNWNTKSEALTSLLSLISKLKGKNISWFLDTKGLLQIFYTQEIDPNIGINIVTGNPRILSTSIEEDGQNIINSQRGSGGANNTITTKLQDIESVNGWTDPNTGLTWPGYGFMPGAILQNSSITNLTDLNSAVQNVLDLQAKPVFTVTLTFTRLPDGMIGQPIYLVDHYKFKGMTFVITSITQQGTNSNRYTTIVATTDPTILGPLSEYEAVKSVVTQGINDFVPFWGTVTDKGQGNLTVQPVNKIATINTKNLGN